MDGDGWMNGWMDERMDKWKDGWMDRCNDGIVILMCYIYIYIYNIYIPSCMSYLLGGECVGSQTIDSRGEWCETRTHALSS